jgi:hypothetical protein
MYTINNTSVVIVKDNHRVELPKLSFSKDILNEAILADLSFKDLMDIWKNLYGIPKNIREILLQKIKLYRASNNIHSFIYKEKEYWLDKNNRTCLYNLSNSSLGDVDFVLGDDLVTMDAIKLKAFLIKLEVYAYKCFVAEFKHIQNAKDLTSLEDIINYDYTTGYPEKITLE